MAWAAAAPGPTSRAVAGPSSPADSAKPVAVIACGALAGHVREIAGRRGWDVRVDALPAMLHNNPRSIAPEAERLARELAAAGFRVALAYADCGSYGELDALCARLGIDRLPGLHCYDVFAGPDRVRAALDAEPGTYLLTDFLIRSFRRSVIVPLGLDRYPELWSDYFGHYRRVVWLAQSRSADLEAEAQRVAAMFGLPLTVIETGTTRLEHELERLITQGKTPAASIASPATPLATVTTPAPTVAPANRPGVNVEDGSWSPATFAAPAVPRTRSADALAATLVTPAPADAASVWSSINAKDWVPISVPNPSRSWSPGSSGGAEK